MIALLQGGSQKKFPGWGLKLEGLKTTFPGGNTARRRRERKNLVILKV